MVHFIKILFWYYYAGYSESIHNRKEFIFLTLTSIVTGEHLGFSGFSLGNNFVTSFDVGGIVDASDSRTPFFSGNTTEWNQNVRHTFRVI